MRSGPRTVVSRDIADTCRGTSLTLVGWFPAGGFAAGLVAAGGVDGEAAQESGLAVDGEVVVAGDHEHGVAGKLGADGDGVAAPADVAGAADGVQRSAGRSRDGVTGAGGFAGSPAFVGCGARQGPVGPVVVVEALPAVELVLQLGFVAGGCLGAQPFLGGLMGAFQLAAGLGVCRTRGRG